MKTTSNPNAKHTQNVIDRKDAWALIDALNGGTAAMRAAGVLYLPQDAKEKNDVYDTRRSRSVLDNYYSEAAQQAVDKIFTRDIELLEQPAPIQMFWSDVDAAGRDGTQFCKDVLQKAIDHGISYVLTDYTKLPEGGFTNRAEELASAGRPYWVSISASQLIGLNSEVVAGREALTFFSYQVQTAVLVDEEYVAAPEVRTFRQPVNGGQVQFKVERLLKGTWTVFSEGLLPAFITAIPITAVYANRNGFYMGTPVFMSLAELNVQHYAKRSDMENLLHIAQVPFLFGKGFNNPNMSAADGRPVKARNTPDTKPELEIDIHNAIMTTNPHADIRWIEHAGTAIGAGAADLARMETRMKELGAALFTTTASGTATATEKAINAAEANARLKSIALALQDCMELALVYVSLYSGAPQSAAAKLRVNVSFSVDFVSDNTMPMVLSLYEIGAIDFDTLIAEAKRRNIIGIDTEVVRPIIALAPTLAPTLAAA